MQHHQYEYLWIRKAQVLGVSFGLEPFWYLGIHMLLKLKWLFGFARKVLLGAVSFDSKCCKKTLQFLAKQYTVRFVWVTVKDSMIDRVTTWVLMIRGTPE